MSTERKEPTVNPFESLTFKGKVEEGNLMKMVEWLKRLEEKQKRVAFCKLGKERVSKMKEWSADKVLDRNMLAVSSW